METPNTLKTKMLSSKENIVGFETWAIIFMFNIWIWKMELDQKCIFNVLPLVLQLPANHRICLGFFNIKFDQMIDSEPEYFIHCICTSEL